MRGWPGRGGLVVSGAVVTGLPFARHRLQIPDDLVSPTQGWGSGHTVPTHQPPVSRD